MLVDAHVHLYEFKKEEVEKFVSHGIVMVAVGEDYESSLKNLDLRDEHPEHIKACVGLHPWNVKDESTAKREVVLLEELVGEADCVGEVGLDAKFTSGTLELQRPVFEAVVNLAKEHDLPLNLHAAGAWREVLAVLESRGVRRAVLHWFTGPLDVLEALLSRGYMITVNAAMQVQEKSRVVAARTPLNMLLTESDGPYDYRGLHLNPLMIRGLVKQIAALKNASEEEVEEAVYTNFSNLFT